MLTLDTHNESLFSLSATPMDLDEDDVDLTGGNLDAEPDSHGLCPIEKDLTVEEDEKPRMVDRSEGTVYVKSGMMAKPLGKPTQPIQLSIVEEGEEPRMVDHSEGTVYVKSRTMAWQASWKAHPANSALNGRGGGGPFDEDPSCQSLTGVGLLTCPPAILEINIIMPS
jgi:hypothetical protein